MTGRAELMDAVPVGGLGGTIGGNPAACAAAVATLEALPGIRERAERGSHVRLRHPDRSVFLVVPLHRELKKGTLNGILTDTESLLI